jgi:hypothetical protein
MAVWHCKLDTPMQILYNACKNTSCKILHATHAKQGATKTEQSRRNCEIKQQFLWTVTLFCNWKTKINFYGGATTNYKKIKVRGFYILLHRKLSSFTIRVSIGLCLGFCVWILCKLSVKIGKTIAKRKNRFGFKLK